jgi:heme oxygenase
VSLSEALREGSRDEHRRAESSRFVADLMAGRVARRDYAAYLRRLREVYAALEEVPSRIPDDPFVEAVDDRALDRLPLLEADLAVWDPDPAPVDSPAAREYRDRILASEVWGGLYAAHHYTRYLGDLSGGQAVGRAVRRRFGVGDRATAFYRFDAIARVKPYRDAYRARLDAVPVSAVDTGRIVTEVRAAFRLNQQLFDEVAREMDAA